MRKFLLLPLLAFIVNGASAQAPTFPEVLNPFPACAGGYTWIVVSYGGGQATSTLWEVSTDGGSTWSPVSDDATYEIITNQPGNFRLGNTGAWLNINNPTLAMNHYQYRLTLSNASGSTGPSRPAILTVAATQPNPAVFDNPAASVCDGQTVLFSFTENYKDDSIWWMGSAFATWDTNALPIHFSGPGNATVNAYVFNGCGGVYSSVNVTVNPSSSTQGTDPIVTYIYPTTYTDASCQPMSVITPSGASPVSGNIQSCVTVDASVQSYNGIPYVPRHYSLEPAANASTSTATVTLYFTQADFDAYNTARGTSPALPQNPTDAAGIANLHVTQFHGTGTTPDTYVGGSGDIDPDDNNIVWNASASRWEVTFNITGFSGFFVSGSPIVPLPLTLASFTGEETTTGNQLHWTTAMEENTASFTIQRQTTSAFEDIAKVPAAGNSHQLLQYSYTDAEKGDARYRLKMADIDGQFTYSRIIALKVNPTGLSIRILPNPASQPQSLTIGSSSTTTAVLTITDMGGRRLREKHLTLQKGDNSLDPATLTSLPQGVYLVSVTTGQQQQTVKFIKE
jgi:hypothetical protein